MSIKFLEKKYTWAYCGYYKLGFLISLLSTFLLICTYNRNPSSLGWATQAPSFFIISSVLGSLSAAAVLMGIPGTIFIFFIPSRPYSFSVFINMPVSTCILYASSKSLRKDLSPFIIQE